MTFLVTSAEVKRVGHNQRALSNPHTFLDLKLIFQSLIHSDVLFGVLKRKDDSIPLRLICLRCAKSMLATYKQVPSMTIFIRVRIVDDTRSILGKIDLTLQS